MSADPQDDADGAEYQQDHGRDEKRTLPDAVECRRKGALDAGRELPAVLGLVAVRLDRADLVERLVDVRADIPDAVLARAREPAHAAPEEQDGHQHERHADEHEQRELGTRQRKHDEPAGHEQHVSDGHGCARADHRLEHLRVVGEARDDLAGARELEVAGRQRQQVVEHRAAQVRGHALAQPRHEVEPRVSGCRHDDDDAEHHGEHAVELRPAAGDETAVDDELESLADCKDGGGGEEQRDGRVDDLPPVGPHEPAHTGDHAERRGRRQLRCVDGDGRIAAGHGRSVAPRARLGLV